MAYLVDHRYLVGHEAVDAIGATEDRREQLERETEGRRRVADARRRVAESLWF